jgi:Rrf2 family protein
MIFSQTSQYALRAVYYLITAGDDKWHLTKDVAEATKIPGPYLARVMSTLAKRGILKSRTGMGGGFRITEEGLKHNLYDVVSQFDNLDDMRDCVFGFLKCCDDGECILHEPWNNLKAGLIDLLKSRTLDDLKKSATHIEWSNIET